MNRSSAFRMWVRVAGCCAVGAALLGCSGADETAGAEAPAETTPASSVADAPEDPVEDGTPAPSDDGSALPLGGINGSALEATHGDAVAMILTRSCDGIGVATGTGFAIDSRTLVTNWHVVADDNEDPDSTLDPRPWILTYHRGWRRGSVIGASATPDVAVIRLDDAESNMAETLDWAEDDVVDDQHLAVLGYPGLENREFQLAVGKSNQSDGTTRGVPSFELERQLSARTGPGTSGGPILTADGDVAGVVTWGEFNRSTWLGQDAGVVREAVEGIIADPPEIPTACGADSAERYPLAYTVRLGTFADIDSADERYAVVSEAGPVGIEVITVNSDDWDGYLLSDYPLVMMAGPFDSRADAREAVELYQSGIYEAGQTDTFSVGVMPTSAFGEAPGIEEVPPCADLSSSWVNVTGVSSADPLKLRDGPTTSASVLAELENGEVLQLVVDEPVEADGLEWLHVALSDDDGMICGWVARRYTTEPSP